MNLYVLRHASAGTRRANPVIDVKRPLDKEGKQQCILIATCLNALNVQFDVIASSPHKRALQTASLVGMELGYESKIHVTAALSPTGSVADFHKLVTELAAHENVLVVGHNPNLQQFLGSLISEAPSRISEAPAKPSEAQAKLTPAASKINPTASKLSPAPAPATGRTDSPNIRLRKGALARVDCTRRPATLNWLLDARMLRTLYSSVTRSSRRKTSKK